MKQIIYVMRFKGQAAPVAGSATVIKATTSAPSCTVTTTVGADGVDAVWTPNAGGNAYFESEARITGETSFLEAGTIRFGDANHVLRFSTVEQGYLGASPDPKLKSGAVTWRIESGQGQFKDANGYITSNFTLDEAGQVTDHHFGVVFIE
jgi:hypothetical protein